MNYCDLAGDGYEEQELRIGEPVPLVTEPLVFKINSGDCSSCQSCSNGRSTGNWHNNENQRQCSTYYDMSNLNATFILSPDFEVDLQRGLIKPQNEGFYAFYFKNSYMHAYIGSIQCINSCFHWVKKGVIIKFKTNTPNLKHASGDFIIKRL